MPSKNVWFELEEICLIWWDKVFRFDKASFSFSRSRIHRIVMAVRKRIQFTYRVFTWLAHLKNGFWQDMAWNRWCLPEAKMESDATDAADPVIFGKIRQISNIPANRWKVCKAEKQGIEFARIKERVWTDICRKRDRKDAMIRQKRNLKRVMENRTRKNRTNMRYR